MFMVNLSHLSQDPPSLPPPSPRDLWNWCAEVGLGDVEHGGLENLGYQVGDKITDLNSDVVKEAGFKPLDWQHVLQAESKYRKCIKAKCALLL